MSLGAKISAVDGAPPALAFPIRPRLVAHPPSCLCRRQDLQQHGRGLLDHHPPELGVDHGAHAPGRRRVARCAARPRCPNTPAIGRSPPTPCLCRSLRVLAQVPGSAAAPAPPCPLAGAHASPRAQYTAENLCEEGIHEVAQKRFVLVAADHPIISAISENADKLQVRNSIRLLRTLRNSILTLASPPLQMGEIAMMRTLAAKLGPTRRHSRSRHACSQPRASSKSRKVRRSSTSSSHARASDSSVSDIPRSRFRPLRVDPPARQDPSASRLQPRPATPSARPHRPLPPRAEVESQIKGARPTRSALPALALHLTEPLPPAQSATCLARRSRWRRRSTRLGRRRGAS